MSPRAAPGSAEATSWWGRTHVGLREAQAVNDWLFNKDTVDKVLAHLMTRGQTVEGGDRLGRCIIFAKHKAHAEFIAQRFDANYPNLKGHFARVIVSGLPYAQSLIDRFCKPDAAPHIAISVDMLDTGIDVPEVVNLVFFKLVRSRTKFWQMIGRGTRLRPALFGPGQDKGFFYVFDFCQTLEFFSQDPPAVEGNVGESLSARLFRTRLEVTAGLDERITAATASEAEAALRAELVETLRAEVAAMNIDNFIIRPKRKQVEHWSKPEPWATFGPEAGAELSKDLAGLPAELDREKVEESKIRSATSMSS